MAEVLNSVRHCSTGTVESALLDLDGLGSSAGHDSRRGAASRALVPCSDVLDKADANDTHAPLEVLRPCRDNRRQADGSHADESLTLEVTEESHGIGSNVRGGVRVSQTGCDGGCDERKTGYDGHSPCDTLLIDGFTV